MTSLKIGELAAATETSAETLRYYESEGVLPRPARSPAGYRLYSDEDVQRVRFIRRARAMGFSLKEVQELLSLRVDRASSTCGEVKQLAEHQLTLIDEKINELQEMRGALERITAACVGGQASATQCTILEALDSGLDTPGTI